MDRKVIAKRRVITVWPHMVDGFMVRMYHPEYKGQRYAPQHDQT